MITIKVLFLLIYAFFAGMCNFKRKSFAWEIAYVIFVAVQGLLFYQLPFGYIGMSVFTTIILSGLFMMVPIPNLPPEKKVNFHINSIMTSLFFWPVKLFDLLYLSINLEEKV